VFNFPVYSDWSPEILIWQNAPGISGGSAEVAVAADSSETLHLVYQSTFLHSGSGFTRQGLNYVQFDDHGHQITDAVMLNDSSDVSARRPQLILYGTDSLMAMWQWEELDSGYAYGFRSRVIINGSVLGSLRYWGTLGTFSDLGYLLDITNTRSIVFVYPDPDNWGQIRAIVENAGGYRLMDGSIIWRRENDISDEISGFVGYSDSLQLVWRQRSSGDPIYTKRISVSTPIDSQSVGDYHSLTPENPGEYYAVPKIMPAGDSLLVFLATYPENMCTDHLHVIHRYSYQRIAELSLGSCGSFAAVEGDSIVSVVCSVRNTWALHFRKYRLPSLQLITDTVLVRRTERNLLALGYTVSPAGVRHLFYYVGIGSSDVHLIYRYWREDLSAGVEASVPRNICLLTAYPNPFNGTTQIEFTLPVTQRVSLRLYDVLGREAAVLLDEMRTAGEHRVSFDGSALASGVYFCRMEAGKETRTQKIVLMK